MFIYIYLSLKMLPNINCYSGNSFSSSTTMQPKPEHNE